MVLSAPSFLVCVCAAQRSFYSEVDKAGKEVLFVLSG